MPAPLRPCAVAPQFPACTALLPPPRSRGPWFRGDLFGALPIQHEQSVADTRHDVGNDRKKSAAGWDRHRFAAGRSLWQLGGSHPGLSAGPDCTGIGFRSCEPLLEIKNGHDAPPGSPLRRRIGRFSIQASISDFSQQVRPPKLRERGKSPARIQAHRVGNVTPTRSRTSGLLIRRATVRSACPGGFHRRLLLFLKHLGLPVGSAEQPTKKGRSALVKALCDPCCRPSLKCGGPHQGPHGSIPM